MKLEQKEILDEFFYSDLVYYIKIVSNLQLKRNEETEKRIEKRLEFVKEENSNEFLIPVFGQKFCEFCLDVFEATNDLNIFKSFETISKYPDVVKEQLKQYGDISISHQKVKTIG